MTQAYPYPPSEPYVDEEGRQCLPAPKPGAVMLGTYLDDMGLTWEELDAAEQARLIEGAAAVDRAVAD